MADLYEAVDGFVAPGRLVAAGDLVEAGDPVRKGREHLFREVEVSSKTENLNPDVHPDDRVPEYPHDNEPDRTEDDVDSTKIGRTDEPFAGAGEPDDNPDDAVGTVELNKDGTGRVGPDEADDVSEHTEDQRLQEVHDGRPDPGAGRDDAVEGAPEPGPQIQDDGSNTGTTVGLREDIEGKSPINPLTDEPKPDDEPRSAPARRNRKK